MPRSFGIESEMQHGRNRRDVSLIQDLAVRENDDDMRTE